MLKDSENISNVLREGGYNSYTKAFIEQKKFPLNRVMIIGFLLTVGILILPWTQNIRGPGLITTLKPQQRPQELNTIIAGRIEKWYVREGDMVKSGDTILKITEVKENYLDPELLLRTEEQIEAKTEGIISYRQKVASIQRQIQALYENREFKLSQLRNRLQQARLSVQSDSINFEAAITQQKIARDQYARQEELYKAGLKSLTELEQRKQALQDAEARKLSAENRFINSKNELQAIAYELSSIDRDFSEKLSKAEADKFATLSEINAGEGDLAKLKNQFSNLAIRNAFYYITAPQDGQITTTIKAGIGEIVKEGEILVKIVPEEFEYAVEMYVRPNDMPLLFAKQKVRFMFDGWPAIVFSGWPNVSYGTYGGKIVAIDNNISSNGKFRILVAEDPEDREWPKALRLGGGAIGMALLKDVPLWYEIWRQLNGFPPDFYTPQQAESKK